MKQYIQQLKAFGCDKAQRRDIVVGNKRFGWFCVSSLLLWTAVLAFTPYL